ncbi:unnamed protein product [Prorocentrum cordatum]|uniref:P-type ATPase C-terminal domain-containing protein n=1 Tax=Prorocentrum cordatum TaxID=2364126 RepID=A0ABN9WTH5_9DINO|nr:unnamed protein product [Polarella glacialis]
MTLLRVVGQSSSEAVLQDWAGPGGAPAGRRRRRGLRPPTAVLDGAAVRHILESDSARRRLYELGLATRTSVCCRLSPAQKKDLLVELVREQDPSVVTLAIGDGANDVPMIQEARTSASASGARTEGMGAVQASDVAISQFRFLGNLLLCHGRRSYHHVALYLCYYLYKNMAVAWGDILHACDIGFGGDIAYRRVAVHLLQRLVHLMASGHRARVRPRHAR